MTDKGLMIEFSVLLNLVADGSGAAGSQKALAKRISEQLGAMSQVARSQAWAKLIDLAQERQEQKAVALTMIGVPKVKNGVRLWT